MLQTHTLTVEEVMRLEALFGMKTMCLLLAVKEQSWREAINRNTYANGIFSYLKQTYNFRADVCRVFEEELKLDEEYQPEETMTRLYSLI